MRFSNYRLLNEMCSTLISALDNVKNTGNLCLKNDCLNFVCSIKNNIERNKDALKSRKINDIIETLLFSLKNNDNNDIDNLIMLANDLSMLCENDIEYKIRVLFVAELGGKWDSMASVYYAMKDREDVIVDVVLQPIFREVLNEDGTKRSNLVYEDWLTPLGIKHILYKEYDMKKIRPDMTFISQPYESVTVPMFWPENIAKYSRLVYLPYFAAITLGEMSTAYNSFFKLLTQKYSWRIICQSETMKNYYKKYASNKGKNVVVTGIPKWDFPMNINKQNTPMPEKWREKLSGKKIFLWNTHFSVAECGSQLLTPKAIEFLKIFIGNPDIALIWRPHPMLESVIKVYYPDEMWTYYLNLRKIVEQSSNMVIDDGVSYAPSFVWSDALISDFSTIIDQYFFMNKPIILLVKDKIKARDSICSENELCDYSKIEFADNLETQIEFIKNVCNNRSDIYIKRQKDLIKKFFSLADGKCGERISETLIDEFKKSVFEPYRMTDILLIGSVKDNEPCIANLESINADYYVCDMYLSTSERNRYPTFSMDEIKDFDYSCIVVTDECNFEFIKSILLNDYDISEEKIMNFWKYYYMVIPKMVCDKEMMKPNPSEYSGIILGISHTEVGLLANQFDKPFCNLAVSSQDLYYQYQTLLYCIEKYGPKIKNLEYAIIDVYDYNYFNYDTSLSKNAVAFWKYMGGFNLLPHNFENNKLFEQNYDEIMKNLKTHWFLGATDYLNNIWNKYFSVVSNFTDYKGFENYIASSNRMKFIKSEHIENYEYHRKTVTEIHDDTIKENKQIFIDIIKLLKSINENIKIYTVIIPKYAETEKRDAELLEEHEGYFNEIIDEVKSQYSFTHLDLKKLTNISVNPTFYYDAAHLNYYGAYIVTKAINNIIFSEK